MEKGNFKVHGIYCTSAYTCYKVQINESGDAARVKYSYYSEIKGKEIETPAKWQKIKYSRKGDPFVTFRGKRLLLDKFMKP